MRSHLLMDETPLVVLPSLAVLVGLNEAIAIQQVHWVCQVKADHEDVRTLLDGEMWCSYTIAQWLNKMPWLSDRTMRRVLTGLEASGLLISVKPNSKDWNHAKWYRIDYEKLNNLQSTVGQNDRIESVKMTGSDRSNLPDQESVKMTGSSIYKKDLKKEILKRDDKNEDFEGSVASKISEPKSLLGKKRTNDAIAKELIQSFTDWDRFFESRKAYLANTEYYRNSEIKIVEGTILKPYRERLEKLIKPWSSPEDKELAIAEVTELIKTHVAELGLDQPTTPKNSQQGGLTAQFEQWVVIYKKDPVEARKLAGYQWNKFLKYLESDKCNM